MSELMQRIIDEANANHAAVLESIEASGGLIEEAETLAATLRSHGIHDARATGFTTCKKVHAYVQAIHATGLALRQALADAGLRVMMFERSDQFCELHLHGLDCRINVDAAAVPALYEQEAA